MNGLPIFSAASQANELRVEPSGCREGHVRVGGASGTRWRHCRALRRASRFTWTYAFSRTQTSVFISKRPLLAQSGRSSFTFEFAGKSHRLMAGLLESI